MSDLDEIRTHLTQAYIRLNDDDADARAHLENAVKKLRTLKQDDTPTDPDGEDTQAQPRINQPYASTPQESDGNRDMITATLDLDAATTHTVSITPQSAITSDATLRVETEFGVLKIGLREPTLTELRRDLNDILDSTE